ncbi:hypothetical protein F400_gp121 [Bacillus phage BCD7]|uniref:Uncharacterized protein n=1 Tax=Bacillus phage BCD7 TaxID=1136534 RepID=J9PU04_9CAUD|nr:hypothetical protein F400_gp121 [Bacillus phage BCD7]AEZ50568.1 hypothetical protein BCD7_0121 [Bacillus phage BCD7]
MSFHDSIINMKIKMLEDQVKRLEQERNTETIRANALESVLAYIAHTQFDGEFQVPENSVVNVSNLKYAIVVENGIFRVVAEEETLH